MHRREDDHHEHRRRSHREDKDDYASKKPRSRWDVDVPKTSEGERSQSSSSRWDDSSGSSSRRTSLNSKSSRWDDKGSGSNVDGSSGSRWDSNGRNNDLERSGSSQSRSRDQKSRSRSNSPFRRNDRDYANYSNPSKDERDLTDSKSSPNSIVNHQPTIQNKTSKKYSSWSDSSSDEEEKPRKIDNVLFKGATIQGLDSQDVKSNVATASSGPGISLKLGGVSSKPMPLPKVISVSVPVKAAKVASIFNDDDTSDEEMPPECKMRMKNVGRETKTSEGPNSFGKTKIGFCNLSHLAEKKLDGKLDAKKKP